MPSRELNVPISIRIADTGLHGDVDAFMKSYEAGEQQYFYTKLENHVRENYEEIVRQEVLFYRNSAPPETFTE